MQRKAKMVEFADFQKSDSLLSLFKDLKKPEISQSTCSIHDPHDIMAIKAD